MKSFNKSLSQVAWAAAALFLATVQGASAQATTPAPAAPHAHHMRYIIVGVLVLIVIIFFIMRARNTKKATT